jgi:hypothetical protein
MTGVAALVNHLRLSARGIARAEVDRARAVLVRHGAEIIEGPSEYDDDPRCYAVFARDPDGMKVEVLHVTLGAPAG